jgi:transcriptional regulator with XRE-family HTH domain
VRKLERKESLVNFGKRLKALREVAEISQEQIHYATGITQPHISAIEAGSLNIGLVHITVLAEFFGLEDFVLLQYQTPLPNSEDLKKNVSRYLKKNGIDPSIFLKKGLASILKNKVLHSKFLSTPRYTKEIATFLEEKFDASFSTTAISQALENLRKKGLVERIITDKKSKYQYRTV